MPPHRPAHLAFRNLAAQFITPHRFKTDRFQYINAINHPEYRRFPVNCCQNSSRCRWHDDIVRHPLHLHFRTGKTGVIPPPQMCRRTRFIFCSPMILLTHPLSGRRGRSYIIHTYTFKICNKARPVYDETQSNFLKFLHS